MDIWAWVSQKQSHYFDQGEIDLCMLIQEFPGWVVNRDSEQVRLNYSRAIQLCKANNDTWLELYFRHWRMQLDIVKNLQIKEREDEIVDLINFSHKDENKACPQSVCTVQDFCIFYSRKDGPAYTPERKQIAEETLARITPSWACYRCISIEYANALMEEGKAQETLDFIKQQNANMKEAGAPTSEHYFALSKAEALIELGRSQEAVNLLDKLDFSAHGRTFVTHHHLGLALAHASTGEISKAVDILPPLEDLSRSNYEEWFKVIRKIAEKKQSPISEENLHHALSFAIELEENGVARQAFNILKVLYSAYKKAGDAERSEKAFLHLEKAAQDLRFPDKALKEIAALKNIAALKQNAI